MALLPNILLPIILLSLTTTACATDTVGPWTKEEALAPEALVATLGGNGPKPAIVYVGFRALFHPGHVPGAAYSGPASQPDGVAALKAWAASRARDEAVVIYCGCCPFDHCPNMVPAYQTLRGMGFTKIRVLILPTNFEKDWVEQGFPIER